MIVVVVVVVVVVTVVVSILHPVMRLFCHATRPRFTTLATAVHDSSDGRLMMLPISIRMTASVGGCMAVLLAILTSRLLKSERMSTSVPCPVKLSMSTDEPSASTTAPQPTVRDTSSHPCMILLSLCAT